MRDPVVLPTTDRVGVARAAPVGPAGPATGPVAPGWAPPDRPVPWSRRVGTERVLALGTLVLLGFGQVIHTELTTGFAAAFLLFPLWVGSLRRFGGARTFLTLGALAVVWGVLVSKVGLPPHMVSGADRNNTVVIMLGTLAAIGVVLWSRTVLSVSAVALAYGVGLIGGGLAGFTSPGDNAWKFVWAVPVAVVVLGLAARTGRRSVEAGALVLLILASAVYDSRSYLASFALSLVLVAWQLRPSGLRGRASWGFNVAVLAALGWAVYYLGTTLLVSGYLGADAQARSVAQIQQSGSLILGGRPELAATFALMRDHLIGYGPGAIPTMHDLLVAKQGMYDIGYSPNNGYVERFMFGGHIELHSMLGDLWAAFGLAGVVLVAVILCFTVRGLAHGIAHRNGSAVMVFACIWTLWNLAFSPFAAAQPTLVLTMGLVLLPVARRQETASDDADGVPETSHGVRP